MATEVIMHINYCEQGQTIEEACQKAADWGYDGIEFRQILLREQMEPEEYYDRVAAAVQKSGINTAIFGGPPTNILNVSPEEREKGVLLQEKYYRLAAERFDIKVWNARTENPGRFTVDGKVVTGSAAADEKHWEAAVQAYKYLGQVAEELGFKIAFETHGGNLTDLPTVTRELVDRIGHAAVGINLDYGNMLAFDDAPSLEEAIRLSGDRLYYVHLKNAIRIAGQRPVQIGLADGQINNREFLRLAKEIGYQGPICLEAPRSGDREWFAQEDLAYARALIADLQL